MIKGAVVCAIILFIGSPFLIGCEEQDSPTIQGMGWEYNPEVHVIDLGNEKKQLTTLSIDFSMFESDTACGCPPNGAAAYADYEEGLYADCDFCFIVDHSLNNCNSGKIHRILADLQAAGITVSLDSVRGIVKETTGDKRVVWQDFDALDGCKSVNHEIHELFPEYGDVYENGTFKFILWDQINNVQIVNEAHLDNLLYLSFSYY